MTHYRRQLELAASPAAVYAALSTQSGLRGWWTQTCEVEEVEGGAATFRFGPHHKTMRIDRLDPEREVRWRCVQAHIEVPGMPSDEWVGTTIAYRLAPSEGQGTRLSVEHLGLTPDLACWELCRTGWDQFLGSLQALVEQGKGQPFVPDDPCAATAAQPSAADGQVTDRIERSIVIQAPRSRVWKLLSDAEAFGRWFGADLTGQTFTPGQVTRGPITIEGFTHLMFEVKVERVEPQDVLAWRWHPYPIDPKVDYTREEPTRVTWTLQDAPGNATRVKTVESGFDQVPPERRIEAFRMNSRGWDAQLQNIRRHAEEQ